MYYQLSFILKRKQLFALGRLVHERPKDILSLNQLCSIFLSCYAFFIWNMPQTCKPLSSMAKVYGDGSVDIVFNQIVIDRKNLFSNIVFYAAIFMSIAGIVVCLFGDNSQNIARYISEGLVILATLMLAQGYTHQILIIRRYGKTGAASLKFNQLVLVTAICTVIFGCRIGLKNGWPLILLASVSAILKLTTLWHFRWVKLSKKAELCRQSHYQ
ncbi:MAG: hypothetical protein H7Z18_04115 [Methylophilaceae bacterium]|nr:hypothetical protein [Methylophilaceae bacterium]